MSYYFWLGEEAQPYADAVESWAEYRREIDRLFDWVDNLLDRAA